MISPRKRETANNLGMLFHLGVAGAYAQEIPAKLTFSGTNVATLINLQPNTVTDEQHSAGNGTFGAFYIP